MATHTSPSVSFKEVGLVPHDPPNTSSIRSIKCFANCICGGCYMHGVQCFHAMDSGRQILFLWRLQWCRLSFHSFHIFKAFILKEDDKDNELLFRNSIRRKLSRVDSGLPLFTKEILLSLGRRKACACIEYSSGAGYQFCGLNNPAPSAFWGWEDGWRGPGGWSLWLTFRP